jgi:hypothetical protein
MERDLMFVFRPTLDLPAVLSDVRDKGAALAPGSLEEDFRTGLVEEVWNLEFERLPREMGPVITEAELFVARDEMIATPVIRALRDELAERVHVESAADMWLAEWWPNEAYVQRYWSGSVGVSPHRDSKRFAYLIAIVTVEGFADFVLCKDRTGVVIKRWQLTPGTLVLLRAPGFGGDECRPFHRVDGPKESVRISLTFRMNTGEHLWV